MEKRHIFPRDDNSHTWQPFRLAGIDAVDAGVRILAAKHLAGQHAGELHVYDVGGHTVTLSRAPHGSQDCQRLSILLQVNAPFKVVVMREFRSVGLPESVYPFLAFGTGGFLT